MTDAFERGAELPRCICASGDPVGTCTLHRLEADADRDNDRSIRALERQGFKREGYLRERWHHLGEPRDTVFLGLLCPDWTRE